VDLAAERALADLLIEASRAKLLMSAHDLSDGGLAQALVESCLRGGIGCRITLPGDLEPFVAMFSESTARAIVTIAADAIQQLVDHCVRHGVPVARLGEVGGDDLAVVGHFVVPLDELRTAHEATLPALFDDMHSGPPSS
jgi:phosphoribosylformylglycinamidine synthase